MRRSDRQLLAQEIVDLIRADVRHEIREMLAAERTSGGEGTPPCQERPSNVLMDHTDTDDDGELSAQERARAALRALRQRTRPAHSSSRSTRGARAKR